MSVQRARSADEYIEWVRQAMFEVGDLRDCLEFEMDEMGHFPAWLDPLERGIKDVFQAMSEGRYAFGREDLPFMDIAEAHGGEIPFNTLLLQLNETHRRGLDVETEA
jgi:hypothetical protein